MSELYDQVVAEEWHAYRSITRTSLYSVEAEDQEEAEALVADGEGTFIDEDTEVGDCYDSEYWQEREVLSEDRVETNVDVVVLRPRRGGVIGLWPGQFMGSVPTIEQQGEPDWEV